MPAQSPRPSEDAKVRRQSADEGVTVDMKAARLYTRVAESRGYTVKAGAATRSRLRRGSVGGHGRKANPSSSPTPTRESE